eukprot:gene1979-1487_t
MKKSIPFVRINPVPKTNEQPEESLLDKKKLKFEDLNRSTRKKSNSLQLQKKTKLSDVLNNSELKKLFENHCAKEYSLENLKFLAQVDNYKLLSNKTERYAKLEEIFQLFLSEKSPNQVNIHKGPVVRIEDLLMKKNLNDITIDVFDGIVTDIHELLNDSLSRFKETKEFKNYGQGGKSRSTFNSPRGNSSDSSEKSSKLDKSQCSSISSNLSSPISSVGSIHSVLELDLSLRESKTPVDSPL